MRDIVQEVGHFGFKGWAVCHPTSGPTQILLNAFNLLVLGICFLGLYPISGPPDIRPFLVSGIWPGIQFHLPDIR